MALAPRPSSDVSSQISATTSVFDLNSWTDFLLIALGASIGALYLFAVIQVARRPELRAKFLQYNSLFLSRFFGLETVSAVDPSSHELNEATPPIAPNLALSEDIENAIVETFSKSLNRDLSPELRAAFGRSLKDTYRDSFEKEALDQLSTLIIQISSASSSVSVRGVVSLVIGIGMAIGTLAVLWSGVNYLSENYVEDVSYQSMIYFGIMRLSVAAFFTFIAYFFLSLYRKSLDDMRYYQDEITNLRSWTAGVILAQSSQDQLIKNFAIAKLLEVDRVSYFSGKADDLRDSQNFKMSGDILKSLVEKIPSGN